MELKSVFRKMFWIRFSMGVLVFLFLAIYVIIKVFLEESAFKQPSVIVSMVLLLFLVYASSDFAKKFSLKVTETGIERIFFLSRNIDFISFDSIESLETKRVRYRNTRGNVSDGITVSFIKIKNKEDFIISPDSYENYREIIALIKSRINN